MGLFLRGKVWWLKRMIDGVDHRWSMRTRDKHIAQLRAPSYERFVATLKLLEQDGMYRRLLCEHLERDTVGWLYFFLDTDARSIKIGFSADVRQRLKHTQIHTPGRLELLGKVRGTRVLEREWHHRFAHLRIRGEWFRAADDLFAAIQKAKG